VPATFGARTKPARGTTSCPQLRFRGCAGRIQQTDCSKGIACNRARLGFAHCRITIKRRHIPPQPCRHPVVSDHAGGWPQDAEQRPQRAARAPKRGTTNRSIGFLRKINVPTVAYDQSLRPVPAPSPYGAKHAPRAAVAATASATGSGPLGDSRCLGSARQSAAPLHRLKFCL